MEGIKNEKYFILKKRKIKKFVKMKRICWELGVKLISPRSIGNAAKAAAKGRTFQTLYNVDGIIASVKKILVIRIKINMNIIII